MRHLKQSKIYAKCLSLLLKYPITIKLMLFTVKKVRKFTYGSSYLSHCSTERKFIQVFVSHPSKWQQFFFAVYNSHCHENSLCRHTVWVFWCHTGIKVAVVSLKRSLRRLLTLPYNNYIIKTERLHVSISLSFFRGWGFYVEGRGSMSKVERNVFFY